MRARQAVEKSCDGIPQDWPPPANGVDYTAAEAERNARKDRAQTGKCAGAALVFTDHIKRRDHLLSAKR